VQSCSENIPNLAVNQYENNADVCQQLANHYGKCDDEVSLSWPPYIQALTEKVLSCAKHYQANKNKCLDLGCSVGGTSFLLAKHFDFVDGVDFSARYIQHGVRLQQGKRVRYLTENEGDIVDFNEVSLTECDLQTSNNILFSQGDACNLKNIFTGYDVIIAQNVLEKSYDPRLFLQNIHQRLTTKGLLFVISTYQFDEQVTQKSKWLGGIKINGENMTGFDGLSQILSPRFTLLEQHQLTRVLKKNSHNFNVSLPHLTVWQLS
jgi:putative 4-mercaptohistidine N1-methyltranferase